ncbi:RodZ domain-containing protein [Agrilactobacillus fermenti]|uniref:helix-turn-helix domain-containing protein n=1 Tax=Agrilactobacillus fermenti TaxID=2586909 RepID=UPI003A5C6F5E
MNELGQKLRQARIDKGYTIDDLQQITKIQKRYLLAIEEGKFDQLPGKFYVNAFIKQYAQTVGLDGQALLQEYQQHDQVTESTPETTDTADEVKSKEATASEAKNQRTLTESTAPRFERIRAYLPQIIIIAVVIILIVGIYAIALSHRRSNSDQQAVESRSSVKVTDERSSSKKAASASSKRSASVSSKQASLAAKQNSRKAKQATTDLKVTSGTKTANGQTFELSNYPSANNTLTLSTKSATAWITVVANGSTQWQGSVSSQRAQSVSLPNGITSFVVTTGNAPVTELKVNDTTVKLPTTATVVQNYTFRIAGQTGTNAATTNQNTTQSTTAQSTTGTATTGATTNRTNATTNQ